MASCRRANVCEIFFWAPSPDGGTQASPSISAPHPNTSAHTHSGQTDVRAALSDQSGDGRGSVCLFVREEAVVGVEGGGGDDKQQPITGTQRRRNGVGLIDRRAGLSF